MNILSQKKKMIRKFVGIFLFLLFFFLAGRVFSQVITTSTYKGEIIEIEWDKNAEIIDHPVYGVIVLSKDRWKNWVFRSLVIIMIYLSMISVVLAMGKTSELGFAVSYILSGALFSISIWLGLSGWMLMRLNSYSYGWSFVGVSVLMFVGSYLSLLKIKNYDISYVKIREELKKINEMKNATIEDKRLVAINGEAGEWEEEDIITL
jgi:hypothetical protein